MDLLNTPPNYLVVGYYMFSYMGMGLHSRDSSNSHVHSFKDDLIGIKIHHLRCFCVNGLVMIML